MLATRAASLVLSLAVLAPRAWAQDSTARPAFPDVQFAGRLQLQGYYHDNEAHAAGGVYFSRTAQLRIGYERQDFEDGALDAVQGVRTAVTVNF